jgi:hypothetical protein
MAPKAAAAPTTEAPAAAPAPASFELDEAQLVAIKPASGRKATDSIFLPDVKLAQESGKARGVAIPEGKKGTQVVSELHKATKQLGIKVQTWNKETAVPPFVAFRVKAVAAPAETPAAETPAE